jgi:hypothetical protein
MFSYFIPGLSKEQLVKGETLDAELLRAFGLGELLADVRKVPAHAAVFNVEKGPHKAGVVVQPVSKHRGVPGVQYDPLLQRWEPRDDDPKRPWLGWLLAETPLVTDFERWELVGGPSVTDPRGNAWTCPIARSPEPGLQFGTLPQSFTFDKRGEMVPHLLPTWQWLWELSGQVRDWYAREIPPPEDAPPAEKAAWVKPSLGELGQYAARLLGANYRVGLPELTWLHERGLPVLTQETIHAICQTAFGWEVLAEVQKKRTATNGPPAPNSLPSPTGDKTPPASLGTAPAEEP